MNVFGQKLYAVRTAIILVAAILLLSACSENEPSVVTPIEYTTIEWTQLMPESDLAALLNPPEFLNSIIDGSEKDTIDSKIKSDVEEVPQSAYSKALVSDKIVPEFDGKEIRLPGFIVPLEFDENLVVTEFFLVPYFGACLHLPPPPPNQIIYVKFDEGVKLESTEQPYWVSGTLSAESLKNDLAQSAYSMQAAEVSFYQEANEEEQ